MDPFRALFILIVILSICEGLHENACNVIPKDQYIEEGSDTQLVCLTSCVRGKIYWTLNNKSLNESLSKTINSTHTVLSLRNFTSHSATLQCHSKDIQQVLGGATIKTYSKPSSISCLLHYENEETRGLPDKFMCQWEHRIDSKVKINYTVQLCGSSFCQTCSSDITTCKSKDIASKIHLLQTYTVIVKAKSAAWEARSEPYTFNSSDILKITRPKLNVATISDYAVVTWKILSYVPTYRYDCQVSKTESGGTPVLLPNNTLNNPEGKDDIEKVESCTNYTFAVRCALYPGLWSNWSQEKTVLTKLDKRSVNLHLWRTVAKAERNGVREVRVMWTEIPSSCQENFTYTVKQTPDKKHMARGDSETLCGNSVCDVDQEAHRIHLTVFHDKHLFAEDSVYIPAVGENLPQVTDIHTTTSNGNILVSWRAPAPAQLVKGYVIDYTHNGNQYYWKEVKYTNTTLSDLLDNKPYNITVTPLFDDETTGHGTEALQICSRVGDPGNVTIINIHTKHKSAFVSWSMKSQEACSGVVVNYTIFYREYPSQKGPLLSSTVDSTKQSILLDNLNPETQYSIYVQATAPTGATKSAERVFKTKRLDPRLILALGVCGGILILLVLFLGLCCATQWKKFKEKPVPNPGHSSLALWPSSHEKGNCHLPPFNNPSESLCDRVYTEETLRTSTSPPAAGYSNCPVSVHPEGYADPLIVPVPGPQDEEPVEPVETQHLSSPGDSTHLLSSHDSPSSPYRSQSFAETPGPRTSKQCKRFPVNQQEEVPPLSVYVTLDMFEQGQGR